MTQRVFIGLLLAVLVASFLRCFDLDRRVMHGDEAVHAVKFGKLWEDGFYKYDPNEYHGPTLYYFTWAWAKISGATKDIARVDDATLRMVPVLFGVGLILIFGLMVDGLGRGGTVWAALAAAISPAMVFYSRYYIHEMPLIFFTLLALAALWRYSRSWNWGWAALAGASIGLMQGTKETFVFTVAAMVGALIVNWIWNYGKAPRTEKTGFRWGHVVIALIAWGAMVVLFFSSFFTNWPGVLDSVRTYIPWIHRAGGASPHANPWDFYFIRLAWFHLPKGPVFSEALILGLCLVGMIASLIGKGLGDTNKGFARFLTFFTLALTVLYTGISYKTPWCLLNFYIGMILLAGIGLSVLIRCIPGCLLKLALIVLITFGGYNLWQQVGLQSNDYCADPHNPYVYAHTSEDFGNLAMKIHALSAVDSQGRNMIVKIMAPESDYWPLPWYLRDYKRVGYWNEMPEDTSADVLVISAKLENGVRTQLLLNDIKDLSGLAKKLVAHDEPVSAFIWAQLGPGTQKSLSEFHSGSTNAAAVNMVLVQNLNSIISGKSLAHKDWFERTELRSSTRTLLGKNPEGEKAARLNRLLLEDEFPTEIVRSQPSVDDTMNYILVGLFELRKQNFLELYVQKDLWKKYMDWKKRHVDEDE